MNSKDLQPLIANMTSKLLKLVDESCWNKVSKNCLYIFSTEHEFEGPNPILRSKIRNRKNSMKRPRELSEISAELESRYDDLYDVNLFVFKAEKKQTILEVRCSLASEQAAKGWPCTPFTEPMLHCKLHLPPYQVVGRKFDINWGHGGFRHDWNMFCWRCRRKRRWR